MSGFNRPQYRRRGLAGLGDPAQMNALSPGQITDFLSRHPGTRSKVILFEGQVEAQRFIGGSYRQGDSGYAIPQYGIAVDDSVYGNVVIFPDADGDLRYTGNVPAGVAGQTNMPAYVPPPGPSPFAGWETLAAAVPWVIGGVLALTAFNALRSRG